MWSQSVLRISAGVSGRCCHLASYFGNRVEGLVPELSLEFCATGLKGVQLGDDLANSDSIEFFINV